MSDSPAPAPPSPVPPPAAPPPPGPNRRWFVILAIVTLIGFTIFVAAITILAVKIPELKKARYGVLEIKAGARPS